MYFDRMSLVTGLSSLPRGVGLYLSSVVNSLAGLVSCLRQKILASLQTKHKCACSELIYVTTKTVQINRLSSSS